LLMALPAGASAATMRVEPFRERPDPSGAPGCAKYSTCPADMVVFTAAPGEPNNVSISGEAVAGLPGRPARLRVLVRDYHSTPMQAGAGCERVEQYAVACTAESLGPVKLGDRADRIRSGVAWFGGGRVSGGPGDDVLDVFDDADGGEGDDLVIGRNGEGGPGDDVLFVMSGEGDRGNDTLRCFPAFASCNLNGGPGNDQLTGGLEGENTLAGGAGRDFLNGLGGKDTLEGEQGNDRLRGGGGKDVLKGGSGADRLDARELRSLGERTAKDDVNCGAGRRDRALTDRRDGVTRCERVARTRRRAR